MNNEKYQGWANRETWCVALWMDNEAHTQSDCQDIAGSATGVHEAAQRLEDYVREQVTAEGMQLDLINCCLARCNWIELAEHYGVE